MKFIKNSLKKIKNYFREGQIFCLESTTYPGTTNELLNQF